MELSASLVGCRVPDRFEGYVHSTFRHGLNVLLPSGPIPIVTVHDSPVQSSPLGIRIPDAGPRMTSVSPGAVVRRDDGVLAVGSSSRGIRICLRTAGRYDGAVPTVPLGRDLGELLEVLLLLGECIDGRQSHGEAGGESSLMRVARDRVRQRAGELGRALGADDVATVQRAAAGLLGLGPGLTPSGDDALVGVLAARHCLGERTGADEALAQLCSDAAAGNVTTLLSAAYLALAAEGQFAEGLRNIARSVAFGDAAALGCSAWRCARTGATSGIDALEGFIAGLAGHVAAGHVAGGRSEADPATSGPAAAEQTAAPSHSRG